jgi:hypothetical protein
VEKEQATLSAKTIQRDIEAGLKWLNTMSQSRNADIRRVMMQAGYTKKEHREGWEHLLYLIGYRQEDPEDVEPVDLPTKQDAAIAELDAGDGPMFERAWAALDRLHKPQCAYVFDNLKAATGVAAVVSTKTFLDRVASLRDGTAPRRKKTRKEDEAAVATLEERGVVNAKVEAHLRELIEIATGLEPPPERVDQSDQEYMEHAVAFHEWLKDWRTTARAVIFRRDSLIRLGLAERRTSAKDADDDIDDETPVEEPVAPEPAKPEKVG